MLKFGIKNNGLITLPFTVVHMCTEIKVEDATEAMLKI